MTDLWLPILGWWAAVAVAGWAAIPVAARVFRGLPDVGLAFAKPLGLLIVGYAFWLGGLARVVPNSRLGAALVVAAWVAFALWLGRRDRGLLDSLRSRRRTLVAYEALFAVAFVAWALYRAASPNIESAGGEKYMEMAFINGILSSAHFPPNDPWLAGAPLSYYYLGYLLGAMLIKLTGIAASVGFNLVVPTAFALTLTAAAGVGYDLAALTPGIGRSAQALTALLAATATAVVGNLEGFLEVMYRVGRGSPAFWNWLNVRELWVNAPGVAAGVGCDSNPAGYACLQAGAAVPCTGLFPDRFIWWWRASRVMHDNCAEIIHEFPFFSFMLGDAHPHVMALPFGITVVGLGLAIVARGREPLPDGEPSLSGRSLWSPVWLVAPFVVGALGFLNAWDLPTYGAVVVGAFVLWVLRRTAAPVSIGGFEVVLAGLATGGLFLLVLRAFDAVSGPSASLGTSVTRAVASGLLVAAVLVTLRAVAARWAEGPPPETLRALHVLRFGGWLAVVSVALYLPFYLFLSSQVEGIGRVEAVTRLPQWLVHFGLLAFLAGTLALTSLRVIRLRARRLHPISWAVLGAAAVVLGTAVVRQNWTAALLALLMAFSGAGAVETWLEGAEEDEPEPEADAAGTATGASARTGRAAPPLGGPDEERQAAAAASSAAAAEADGASEAPAPAAETAPTYALLLAAAGFAVVLLLEFVFVRDLFGTRMNSIFKFYYQGWALLALAGAYAPVALYRRVGFTATAVWGAAASLLLLAGLVYPVASVRTRTASWRTTGLSLDGLAWWQWAHPNDLVAAEWLRDRAAELGGGPPVVVEAAGDSYRDESRISLATGFPTLLGWDFHERQWGRDPATDIEPRKTDLETIYTSQDTGAVRDTLDKYDAHFVVLGPAERERYGLGAEAATRFDELLDRAFESGDLTVYEVPW